MPQPLTVSCFRKSRFVLPFSYRLTQVVPEKEPLTTVCVCVGVVYVSHNVLRFLSLSQ